MNLSFLPFSSNSFAILATTPTVKVGQEQGSYKSIKIVPGKNDILLGRGGKNNQHSGNVQLRNLARSFCSVYHGAKKKEKPAIAQSLVGCVRNLSPPGRFLKHTVEGWEEATESVAQEKASQSLRDTVASVLKEAAIQDGTELPTEIFTQACLKGPCPVSSRRHATAKTPISMHLQQSNEQLTQNDSASLFTTAFSSHTSISDSPAVHYGNRLLPPIDVTLSAFSLESSVGKQRKISFPGRNPNTVNQHSQTKRARYTAAETGNYTFEWGLIPKLQSMSSDGFYMSCHGLPKLLSGIGTGNGGISLNDVAQYAHLATQREKNSNMSEFSVSDNFEEGKPIGADALDAIVWDEDDIDLDSSSSFPIAPSQHQEGASWDDEDAFRRNILSLLQEI